MVLNAKFELRCMRVVLNCTWRVLLKACSDKKSKGGEERVYIYLLYNIEIGDTGYTANSRVEGN